MKHVKIILTGLLVMATLPLWFPIMVIGGTAYMIGETVTEWREIR